MQLYELDPKFLHYLDDGSMSFGEDGERHQQGVRFLCPACFLTNNGPIGTHSVICWFLNPALGEAVSADVVPGPGRWRREGNNLDHLTLGPGPNGKRSVQLLGGCNAHFHITNGEIEFC